jgi:hypothetical protein
MPSYLVEDGSRLARPRPPPPKCGQGRDRVSQPDAEAMYDTIIGLRGELDEDDALTAAAQR